MINYENFVNVDKVAKQAKKAGEFIMFKCKSGNLIVTNKFIINLTSEQFFKLQCKLELPELGIWYLTGKNLPERSEREANLLQLEKNYNDWLIRAENEITNTRLTLCEQYAVYSDGITYVALQREQIDMINAPQVFLNCGSVVSIDELHILTKVKDCVFNETEYLKNL